MGLLDDAIREHLDLKRRRGADPTEVARLEHEALGPVRREPARGAEPADEPTAAAPEQPHAPAEAHPADEGRPADDATRVLAPEDRHEPPHGDPLAELHAENVELGGAAAAPERASEPEHELSVHEPREPKPAPEQKPEPEDPRLSDIVHQPTTEFRVEDHHDDEDEQKDEGKDEDVLEETPEFLQETPEHDRLWFEQRPPRDFDFDG
jgi:hypothetical protein